MVAGEPWNNKDHPDYAPSLDGNTAKEDIQHQTRLQRLALEMSLYLTCLLQFYLGFFLFLTGRTKLVKHGFHLSSPKPINSRQQYCSRFWSRPTLYIIMEGDLRALSNTNLLFEYIYADDTSLLVPEIPM